MRAGSLAPTLAVVVLAAPLAAAAQSPTTTGVAASVGGDETSPWGGMVISDTTLGFGTFVSGHANDPYLAETISLRPSYRVDADVIPGGASLILRQDLLYELTEPNNGAGRSFDYGDTYLWLIAPSLHRDEASGIVFGGEARVAIPISYASRWQDRITTATLGLRTSRRFGDFLAQLRVQGTKHFYAENTKYVEEGEVLFDDGTSGCHQRSGNDACRAVSLANWQLTTYGALTYAISEKLSLTYVGQWAAGWRFSIPEDEYTSPNAQSGTARMADSYTSTFDVSYALDATWNFSAGVNTTQPVLTADNKSFRFPLVDVTSPANNYSGLYFDVIAVF